MKSKKSVAEKLVNVAKNDPEFSNLVQEFIKWKEGRDKGVPSDEKEKSDYEERKLLLNERKMEKKHLLAEIENVKEILGKDWGEYAGPWIKDDHLCMLMGDKFVPFGPRSKAHLKIDLERAESKIEVIDKLIDVLNKLIKEYEEKYEEKKDDGEK